MIDVLCDTFPAGEKENIMELTDMRDCREGLSGIGNCIRTLVEFHGISYF